MESMQCMEIWGGNREIEKNFQTPGLEIYVYSQPFEGSETGGGDIYYLTSCASGRISRFLLADVSGHGKDASELAIKLRDMMRANVNRISQESFAQKVNREFSSVAENMGFATAVIVTFFRPSRRLTINIAGHPHPVYYQSSENRWKLVDIDPVPNALHNLPFGIHEGVAYPNRRIDTRTGDMFLLYSDAFIESVGADGKQLGHQGLVNILNERETGGPEEVIPYLRKRLSELSDENLKGDDATAIVGLMTQSKTSWKNNLLAPFRLLGSVRDRTALQPGS
ncbi:MAG: PP2C family protein-serine/threonine phosphatase [Planctomycetota bacterium]|nr:PP2C family protein-serine/threonine phosphatase [Planctomycetota bacterium]